MHVIFTCFVWTKGFQIERFAGPDKTGEDYVHAGNLQYFSRKWLVTWQHEYIGKNFNAEVGYVPRVSYAKINPLVTRLFFPKGGNILSHGPTLSTINFYNTSFKQTDYESLFTYLATFRTKATLSVSAIHDYVRLLRPFDPTNSAKDTLATGSEHSWDSYGLDYVSKPQSVFTYILSFRNGGYYNHGTRFNLTFELRYRFQPYVSITVNSSYDHIVLPPPWGLTRLWLISPKQM